MNYPSKMEDEEYDDNDDDDEDDTIFQVDQAVCLENKGVEAGQVV